MILQYPAIDWVLTVARVVVRGRNDGAATVNPFYSPFFFFSSIVTLQLDALDSWQPVLVCVK